MATALENKAQLFESLLLVMEKMQAMLEEDDLDALGVLDEQCGWLIGNIKALDEEAVEANQFTGPAVEQAERLTELIRQTREINKRLIAAVGKLARDTEYDIAALRKGAAAVAGYGKAGAFSG